MSDPVATREHQLQRNKKQHTQRGQRATTYAMARLRRTYTPNSIKHTHTRKTRPQQKTQATTSAHDRLWTRTRCTHAHTCQTCCTSGAPNMWQALDWFDHQDRIDRTDMQCPDIQTMTINNTHTHTHTQTHNTYTNTQTHTHTHTHTHTEKQTTVTGHRPDYGIYP